MTSYLFWLPIGLYTSGWLVEFSRFLRGPQLLPRVGGGLLAMGWGAHTLFLALQVTNGATALAQALVATGWLSLVVYYLVQRQRPNTVYGFIFPPFAIHLLLIAALVVNRDLSAQSLGLDSRWVFQTALVVHILSFLAGNVLFLLACMFSIFFLIEEGKIKSKAIRLAPSRVPSLGVLDRLTERAVAPGFFLFSLGMLMGLFLGGPGDLSARILTWRDLASILTWLVYAAWLLERFVFGSRGRFMAMWSIGGFVVVLSSLAAEMWVLMNRG